MDKPSKAFLNEFEIIFSATTRFVLKFEYYGNINEFGSLSFCKHD